jgi:hypothetical protein
MEDNLGLRDAEHRSWPLLTELAREFHERMQEGHQGHYTAPWGEIQLVESEHSMLLIERLAERRQERQPYKRARLITGAARASGKQD